MFSRSSLYELSLEVFTNISLLLFSSEEKLSLPLSSSLSLSTSFSSSIVLDDL